MPANIFKQIHWCFLVHISTSFQGFHYIILFDQIHIFLDFHGEISELSDWCFFQLFSHEDNWICHNWVFISWFQSFISQLDHTSVLDEWFSESDELMGYLLVWSGNQWYHLQYSTKQLMLYLQVNILMQDLNLRDSSLCGPQEWLSVLLLCCR